MEIVYKTGDLLGATEQFILHGCNAQGAMNSGVAKAIRETYPKAYVDYRNQYDVDGLVMGDIIISINHPHVVLNAITQEFYGRDKNTVYVSYDAVEKAMSLLDMMAGLSQNDENYSNKYGGTIESVAMPMIGAGLGNGRWDVISTIIEHYSDNYQPVIYQL